MLVADIHVTFSLARGKYGAAQDLALEHPSFIRMTERKWNGISVRGA
jgi:hypothetical protein